MMLLCPEAERLEMKPPARLPMPITLTAVGQTYRDLPSLGIMKAKPIENTGHSS